YVTALGTPSRASCAQPNPGATAAGRSKRRLSRWRAPMINAVVVGEDLNVTVTAGDAWLLAMRPQWTVSIPVATVHQAQAGPKIGLFTRRHAVARASEHWSAPGRLICARFQAPTLRLDLTEGPFRRMVLTVPDPEATAQAIRQAIPASSR